MPEQTPKPTETKPPVKIKGKSLRWTPEEIRAMATIEEGDLSASKAFFRRVAPRPYKSLLDARKTPTKPQG